MTNYSKEFKEDAIAYVQNHPDKSVTQCAKDLGINPNTLHGWISRVKQGGELHRGSGNYASEETKEIARLKKELRDTQDALNILKKTIKILGM